MIQPSDRQPLDIVATTPHFYIINKEVVQSFHTENNEDGIVELLEIQTGEELFAVNRLDRVTSGLLLIARTKVAQSDLNALFEQRQIEKFYLALSATKPKKKQGTVSGDMARSRRASWKLLRTKNNPAITQFFSFGSSHSALSTRLFVIRLLTGKTHQIRVALKSLGTPIIGDPTYNAQHSSDTTRTYLHSYALCFSLYGEEYSYVHFPKTDTIWEQSPLEELKERLRTPLAFQWPKNSKLAPVVPLVDPI